MALAIVVAAGAGAAGRVDAQIAGVVKDAQGRPLAGVTVNAQLQELRHRLRHHELALPRRLATARHRADVELRVSAAARPSWPERRRRFRFVGVPFETFDYDDATPEQAAFFDRMLDAMCYAVPVEAPAQPKR